MENSVLRRSFLGLSGPLSALLLIGAGSLTSCSDDLLTGQPSWLGSSIYEELEQRGNFKTTLELINAQSEDYATVLRQTGSRTLFAADDAAWQRWFQANPWGVKSIAQMTEAQKRLAFKGNMISSAYLVELLGDIPSASATSDPIEGSCMRRASSVNLMDSVPVVARAQYPVVNPVRLDATTHEQVDWWSRVRGKDKIYLLQDNNVQTMIHFMPRFMKTNNITSDDVSFLTGGQITSNTDAFINGQPIVEKDITCQNGYIHVLGSVATPLDNMANLIAGNPQTQIYSRLLDRFSYPHYDAEASREFQRQMGGEDSVYVKRYFNSHQANGFKETDQKTAVSTQLPYDPGWNRYALYSAGGQSTYQYDAAVMLVPTDEAMMRYLETDGSDLQDRYGKAGPGPTAWDNAPDEVVLPLLQNTMLSSLKSAIPSQFKSINNTAAEPMGVKKDDISHVYWGCNGLVYETNKVYVAPEYVSVFYPCVIRANDDLRLAYTVVSNDNKTKGGEGFYAYLNNMGSKYSYIIPTDNALQRYFDPVSYKRTNAKGVSTALAYKFYINDKGYIAAYGHDVDWTQLDAKGGGTIGGVNSSITISSSDKSNGDAFNHFKDIINSSLAVGLFQPGQKFYQAKNYGPIVVEWDGTRVKGVAGSFQYERGYYIPVIETVDKSAEGNGRSYIVDDEPLMSTMVSPYAALTNPDNDYKFGRFASLMLDAQMFSNNDGAGHTTMDSCLTTLNNYHYTIYVPTNESVQALIDAHRLPTGDDIDAVRNCYEGAELDSTDEAFLKEQELAMTTVLQNFVNYHIQDNAVYVEGETHQNDVFESACLDTASNRFVKLYVSYNQGGDLRVTDNCGNVRTVNHASDLHNILTRQYYFNGAKLKDNSCTQIYSSSFAVIHQIDAPLMPSRESLYDPAVYARVMDIIAKYPVGGQTPDANARRR